eukprot:1924214-Rhodomonas_salina.12
MSESQRNMQPRVAVRAVQAEECGRCNLKLCKSEAVPAQPRSDISRPGPSQTRMSHVGTQGLESAALTLAGVLSSVVSLPCNARVGNWDARW